VATSPCPGCGVVLPVVEGPTHAYMESSPACWSAYAEVLAREYSDPALFARVHRLTVDTYAVQHPGHDSPPAVQSVAVHLISLCALHEQGATPERARDLIREAVRVRGRHPRLARPADLGAVTVAEVRAARTPAEHEERVRAWARSAWDAWGEHHPQVRAWLAELTGPS
jgi:hypothetical protein